MVKTKARSYYLPLSPLKLGMVTDGLTKLIHESRLEFDGIAGRGVSGILVAGILGLILKKPVAIVRKGGEDTHSVWSEEVGADIHKYIIVDDLIESGKTIVAIMERMAPADCRGIFLYNDDRTKDFLSFPVFSMGVWPVDIVNE